MPYCGSPSDSFGTDRALIVQAAELRGIQWGALQ